MLKPVRIEQNTVTNQTGWFYSELGFGGWEIMINVLQARSWITSGLPTNRPQSSNPL
jgi:hypothetical protein